MAKTFFNLPGYYEGLRARRVKHSGRLWFVKVISDPDKEQGLAWKPYWFVLIRNFDLRKDRASGAKSIGVWRFQREEDAAAKYSALLPLYPAPAPKPLSQAQANSRALFIARQKSRMKSAGG